MLTKKQQELVTTLEILRIEEFIYSSRGFPGRPLKDRSAIARAFMAKMVYNMLTTRSLLDRLTTDSALRRICGWEQLSDIPGESIPRVADAVLIGSITFDAERNCLVNSYLQGLSDEPPSEYLQLA